MLQTNVKNSCKPIFLSVKYGKKMKQEDWTNPKRILITCHESQSCMRELRIARRRLMNQSRMPYQKSSNGLTCSLCNCMICSDCIDELCQVDPRKNIDKYHSHSKPFLEHIMQYQNTRCQAPGFVGHCCLVNWFYGKMNNKDQVGGRKHQYQLLCQQTIPWQTFNLEVVLFCQNLGY